MWNTNNGGITGQQLASPPSGHYVLLRTFAGNIDLYLRLKIVKILIYFRFLLLMYKNKEYEKILLLKYQNAPNVVDMTILYLWWVSHHDSPGYSSGNSWYNPGSEISKVEYSNVIKRLNDDFLYVKTLTMPKVDRSLRLCNGLDVVNRTVFDHMHIFFREKGFTYDFGGGRAPYFIGAVAKIGGIPESIDDEEVKMLEKQKLYVINIHYQGETKPKLIKDCCDYIKSDKDKFFFDPIVENICK